MGCGASSNANAPSLQTSSLKTEFRITDQSWEILNSSFEKLSKEGIMEMETFVDHFSKFGAGTKLAAKIGKALDTDNSGTISKYEYLRFFCIHIAGSEQQKIASFFSILDSDGSGKVDKKEITDFFARSLTISNPSLAIPEAEKRAKGIADDLVKELDTSGDHELSLKEVMVACDEDADYRNLFTAFSKGIASKLM